MIVFVVIIIFCILTPVVFFVWMHTARLAPQDADALIVLGYRCDQDRIHPFLQERIDTAVSLWEKYRFRYIIVSGGAVTSSVSEAEIMKRHLVSRGVEPSRILLENCSRNTVQNIVNCRILMHKHGLNSCLLVSNSFHIRRMKYIMNQLQISASFYADRRLPNIMRQWGITFREIQAFRLTLPWLDKVKRLDRLEMMGGNPEI
jgi:uncharacterized SAM-binding protein YcdF (DUF218 family)